MAGSKTRVTYRVVHVVRPSAGGIVSSLCTLLTNDEFYSEVISTAETLERIQRRWSGTTHKVPSNAFSISNTLIAALQISRLAKLSKMDVIHGHGITVLPALALAGMLSGCQLVLTLHNMLQTSRVQRLVLMFLCRNVHLICVSDAILASAMCLHPRSAVRIYNGVAIPGPVMSKGDAREALGLDPNAPIVMSVSRLSPEKGLADLAAAAKQILGDVVIVGDGPEREALSKCDDITLVGHVEKPWLWYCAADVVAVPSHTEGLGLSAIEALSTGCPVIASDVGGLPEVISNDYLGKCVPVGDVTALASAINDQLNAGRGNTDVEEKRRFYVTAKFSVMEMLDETSALYGRILGR